MVSRCRGQSPVCSDRMKFRTNLTVEKYCTQSWAVLSKVAIFQACLSCVDPEKPLLSPPQHQLYSAPHAGHPHRACRAVQLQFHPGHQRTWREWMLKPAVSRNELAVHNCMHVLISFVLLNSWHIRTPKALEVHFLTWYIWLHPSRTSADGSHQDEQPHRPVQGLTSRFPWLWYKGADQMWQSRSSDQPCHTVPLHSIVQCIWYYSRRDPCWWMVMLWSHWHHRFMCSALLIAWITPMKGVV